LRLSRRVKKSEHAKRRWSQKGKKSISRGNKSAKQIGQKGTWANGNKNEERLNRDEGHDTPRQARSNEEGQNAKRALKVKQRSERSLCHHTGGWVDGEWHRPADKKQAAANKSKNKKG